MMFRTTGVRAQGWILCKVKFCNHFSSNYYFRHYSSFFQNGILTKGNFLAPTPLQSILLFWSLGKWKVVNSNECCPNSFLPPTPPPGHHRALFADPIFFLSDRRHDIRNENTVYILPATSICIKYTTLRFVKRYPFSLVFWYYPVVLKSAQTILVTILTPPNKTKKRQIGNICNTNKDWIGRWWA